MKNESLQEKYLPEAQFQSQASVSISAHAKEVYPRLELMDFSEARLSYLLFRLRGIQVPQGMGFQGLSDTRFYKLDTQINEALLLGLIGQFWTYSGNLQEFDPRDFKSFDNPSFAKSTWQFQIHPLNDHESKLELSTRIYCPTEQVAKKMDRYWKVIKPMSNLVRLEILQSLKKRVEKGVIS